MRRPINQSDYNLYLNEVWGSASLSLEEGEELIQLNNIFLVTCLISNRCRLTVKCFLMGNFFSNKTELKIIVKPIEIVKQ